MADLQAQPLKKIHEAKAVPERIHNIEKQRSSDQADIVLIIAGLHSIIVIGRLKSF